MTVEELNPIVSRFRRAIEESDLSIESIGEEASGRMREFPDSACAETTTILGIFLTDRFGLTPLIQKGGQIEKGELWWGTHEWLKHNDIIIDITADQFDMVNESVIVTEQSEFHYQYVQKEFDYNPHFILANHEDWKKPLYDVVVAKYDELENNENQDQL
jgi:hypothetical protein